MKADWKSVMTAPGEALVNALAMMCPFDPAEKQALLEAGSFQERASTLMALLEMGGAGMVDPRVFENVGVDPEEWSGFAFGCGIERVAQLKYDFPDIRALWEGDLRVLNQF